MRLACALLVLGGMMGQVGRVVDCPDGTRIEITRIGSTASTTEPDWCAGHRPAVINSGNARIGPTPGGSSGTVFYSTVSPHGEVISAKDAKDLGDWIESHCRIVASQVILWATFLFVAIGSLIAITLSLTPAVYEITKAIRRRGAEPHKEDSQ